MLELLVLRHDDAYTHKLPEIIHDAGYQIINLKDLVACGRRAPDSTINLEEQRSEILACILTLARQLNPGWRLHMRDRRLEAPNGESINLTSLEFNFLKIFSMVEVNEAVSRKKIVKEFGEDYLSYDQNRIDTMVKRLRKKIETHIHVKLPLKTERVRGFSFGDVLIIDP